MNKKTLLSFILLPLSLYSSAVFACSYCYGYHDNRHANYSENSSKLMRSFEEKRYELNKLYDQGVSESDKKAQALIKDLDSISNQIQVERESNRSSRHNRSYDRCW
ncbi:MAG: hypothetical protein ACRCTT_07810 [Enterobacter roggenkampii]